ncbi:MAG: aspartate kinase [Thermoprotei archaeon]
MRKLVILKLGGSVLSDEKAIKEAARFVSEANKSVNIVVVVSALKGVTDELSGKARAVSGEPDPTIYDELISMGERISARLFALALRAVGVQCVVVDVDTPYWPVITDETHFDAEPLLDESTQACDAKLRPLIERSIVPVVCGFIGVSKSGWVTTLGRGGSDTTATLLGRCLNADEVVLIKDVDGLLSTDPKAMEHAKKLDVVSVGELAALAKSGAKVVHEKALRYVNGYRLRITSLREGLTGGTLVVDTEDEVSSSVGANDVNMITLVGLKNHGFQTELAEVVDSGVAPPLAVTFDSHSATLYTTGAVDEKRLHTLVDRGLIKAVAVKRNLSCVTVSGRNLEGTPGVILRITEPLYQHGINLYGITTSANTIRVFVQKEVVEKVKHLISASLNSVPVKGDKVL